MARFTGILFCVLLLSACAWDHSEPGPCGDCPERIVDIALECRPCGVGGPIAITMENKGQVEVYTDACSWRLIHVDGGTHRRPFFREVVYTPDCSAVDPHEIAIPPGSTEMLTVTVDPAAIPQLSTYPFIAFELSVWRIEGDESKMLDLRTGPVEVDVP